MVMSRDCGLISAPKKAEPNYYIMQLSGLFLNFLKKNCFHHIQGHGGQIFPNLTGLTHKVRVTLFYLSILETLTTVDIFSSMGVNLLHWPLSLDFVFETGWLIHAGLRLTI